MDPALRTRLDAISRTPILLIASDFDGTLSPIVADPPLATPERRCMDALVELGHLDHTHAAIVSGRGFTELGRLSGAPARVLLVGSHGAEHGAPLEGSVADLLTLLARELEPLADTSRGFLLERKPFAIAFHYRAADPRDADRALAAILAGPATRPGVRAIHGNKVLELAVSDASKATAVARLRHETGATAVVFLGDDPSDEEAIRTLAPSDLGVRVGAADTSAHARTPDVAGVADILQCLLAARRGWLRQPPRGS
jgi:trehalose 6-phosphate phosphatase